ncbi:MAG: biopolymer transporter ExbD [bacterium]|nr:biopolymer transporter ExbD [bacterium]
MGAEVGGSDTVKSEPNVVPLCDILLVLLIIFMVVTPMIQKGANVSLPEAEYTADQPKAGDMLEVFVKTDGTVYFDEVAVEDLTKLATLILDKLEENQPDDKTKILLKADKDVEYGKVVDVMNLIKDAEIEVIGLVVDKVSR